MTHCTKYVMRSNASSGSRPPPVVVTRADTTCCLERPAGGAAPSSTLSWPGGPSAQEWQSCSRATYTPAVATPTPVSSTASLDNDPVLLLKSLEAPGCAAAPLAPKPGRASELSGVSISSDPAPSLLVRSTHNSDCYPRYPREAYLAAGVAASQCKPVKTKSDVVITGARAAPHQYETMLERQFQHPGGGDGKGERSMSPSAMVAQAKAKLGKTQFVLGTDAVSYETVSDRPMEITRPSIKNKTMPLIPGNKFAVTSVEDARPQKHAEAAGRSGSAVPFEQSVLNSVDLLRAGNKRTTALESMPHYDQQRRASLKSSASSAIALGTDTQVPWCTTHQNQFPGIYFKQTGN
jgi:hypothetical protein